MASLSQRVQLELLGPTSLSGAGPKTLASDSFPSEPRGSRAFSSVEAFYLLKTTALFLIVHQFTVTRVDSCFPPYSENLYSKYFYIFLKYPTKFVLICAYGKKSKLCRFLSLKQTYQFHNKRLLIAAPSSSSSSRSPRRKRKLGS